MIRAMIFDLDGRLVKTELLKSLSYAQAVQRLSPAPVSVEEVQRAFAEVVGRSREEVSAALLQRFSLQLAAEARLEEFQASEPWEVLVRIRLAIYEAMLADPGTLRANQWPHAVDLLRAAVRNGCSTALASTSSREQVRRVLEAVRLEDQFRVVLAREDVQRPKPDPEIYLLAARLLQLPPRGCLVIEDSPTGVQAAVSAGMHCVAVATPFTLAGLRTQRWLAQEWVVEDPAALPMVVERVMALQSAERGAPDSHLPH
jgi:HAD superfamily hydrolase (TIGR01509 family)